MEKKASLLNKIILAAAVIVFASGCGAGNGETDGTGTIEAREVQVSALLSSTIDRIAAEEGDRVREGDLLAELDHTILDYRLQQALSREKQVRAQLELLREGARSEDIQQAEAQLAQARQNLELAKKEWDRIRSLYEEGSVTKREYDTVQNQYETGQSRYEAARAALNKVKDFARPQEIESAEAAVEQAVAETAVIRRQIEDCRITAPIAGSVSEVYYEEGEVIQAGRPLLSLRDMEEMYVTVYLPGPMLAEIKVGEAAYVYVDGVPDRPFEGTIAFISDEAEFTPKNVQTKEQRVKLVYAVRIDVANRENILKPGMPADIILGEK